MNVFLTFLASIATFAGIGLLYASWRSGSGHQAAVVAGWGFLILSLVLWSLGSGPEFGLPFALLSLSLVAWLAVGLNYEIRRYGKSREKPYGQQVIPGARSLLQHGYLFLLAVPLAGLAAIFCSVALSIALPLEDVDSLVLSVLLMPLLWGLASYWICAASELWRPVLTLTVLLGLSALWVLG